MVLLNDSSAGKGVYKRGYEVDLELTPVFIETCILSYLHFLQTFDQIYLIPCKNMLRKDFLEH